MLLRSSGLAAFLLVSAAGFAIAQSDPAAVAAPEAKTIGPPEAKTNGSSRTPATGQFTPAAAGSQNSTTGAASTDVPMPSVVTHIMSGADAAKFNAAADADDKRPTLAHALALTDEQKRLISSSVVAGKETSGPADFKPEVAALAPSSAKLQDLPPEITAKIPHLQPYKVAVVDNQILLVDPGNSNVVVGILNR